MLSDERVSRQRIQNKCAQNNEIELRRNELDMRLVYGVDSLLYICISDFCGCWIAPPFNRFVVVFFVFFHIFGQGMLREVREKSFD